VVVVAVAVAVAVAVDVVGRRRPCNPNQEKFDQ
jgi:hypothetical protein